MALPLNDKLKVATTARIHPAPTPCTQIKRNPNNTRGFFCDELTKQRLDHKQCFDFGYVPHPELPEDAEANVSPVEGFNRWPDALVRVQLSTLHARVLVNILVVTHRR